jgi:ABC-type transport system involved in Fe-S cluster assembly fused permease/ATPase subunit
VDRFVRSLPDGYDTVIDEEGSNVSAGEKQLITIARRSCPTLLEAKGAYSRLLSVSRCCHGCSC